MHVFIYVNLCVYYENKCIFFYFLFYLYINEYKYSINLLSEKTDVILNRAKDYYKNYSDKIKKQAREKYNIPKEKIDK